MISKYLPERRLEFFWLRLAASGVILALFIGLVRLAWYPNLLFQLSGTWKFVLITVPRWLRAQPGSGSACSISIAGSDLPAQDRQPARNIEQAHQRCRDVG
jgi:hypothetical protein